MLRLLATRLLWNTPHVRQAPVAIASEVMPTQAPEVPGNVPEPAQKTRKYALAVVGSVSHMKSLVPGEIYDGAQGGGYSPLRLTAGSIRQHVVAVNGGGQSFDVFIHSWHPDLRQTMVRSFTEGGGRLVWAEFENNTEYERLYAPLLAGSGKDWHQVGRLAEGRKIREKYAKNTRNTSEKEKTEICAGCRYTGRVGVFSRVLFARIWACWVRGSNLGSAVFFFFWLKMMRL
jgi:hypothetical protein